MHMTKLSQQLLRQLAAEQQKATVRVRQTFIERGGDASGAWSHAEAAIAAELSAANRCALDAGMKIAFAEKRRIARAA